MDAASLLAAAAARLSAAGIDTARLDAEVLLAHALGIDRSRLFARLRDAVAPAPAARFEALLTRRAQREPVAYLTGEQEFWSLRFAVTPDVLIPRPETELLVELALRELPAAQPRAVLDVGTGSGCVAIAIAHERPLVQVTAVDVSDAALAVARHNAAQHGVTSRIAFVASDLFAGLSAAARFDVIASNPPYLGIDDQVSPEVAGEPRRALYAGADGLAVLQRLIAAAPSRLRRRGCLLVEIGAGQTAAVLQLARRAGFADCRVAPDLAGIGRVLRAATADPR